MASVQTAKSKPALCLFHQPFLLSAIAARCHLFVRQHKIIAVLWIDVLGAPERNDRISLKTNRGNYPRFYSGTYILHP